MPRDVDYKEQKEMTLDRSFYRNESAKGHFSSLLVSNIIG